MHKHRVVTVDGAFPRNGREELIKYLDEGYEILQVTVTAERYIHYVLRKWESPDVMAGIKS